MTVGCFNPPASRQYLQLLGIRTVKPGVVLDAIYFAEVWPGAKLHVVSRHKATSSICWAQEVKKKRRLNRPILRKPDLTLRDHPRMVEKATPWWDRCSR